MIEAFFGWKVQFALGIAMVVGALISWPLASFSFAAQEPQFIIALSELALVFSGYGVMANAVTLRRAEIVEANVV